MQGAGSRTLAEDSVDHGGAHERRRSSSSKQQRAMDSITSRSLSKPKKPAAADLLDADRTEEEPELS
jgi:hypothetical protein